MKRFKKYDPTLFRTKRILCGISQKELADICQISKPAVSHIECGRTPTGPSITLIGIALDMIALEKGLSELFAILEKDSLS